MAWYKTGGGGTDTSDATLNNGNQLLKDVTAYANDVKYTGTIESEAGGTKYASRVSYTVVTAPKYITSDIAIGAISTDLKASNLQNGVVAKINNGTADIFSITGTYKEIDTVSSVPSTRSTDIIYNSTDKSYYSWEYPNGLCFKANTAGSTVAMSVTGTPTLGQNFSYSTDGDAWATFVPGTTTITLTNVGDRVFIRGNNPNGVSESNSIYYKFTTTGSISVSGNIMSLIDNGACNTLTIPNNFCFYNLFYNCMTITTPPELPATTLANNCYQNMFGRCTYLTEAPALPATTMATSCYNSMFDSCMFITSAPELPATTLADYCYSGMFGDCSRLTTVPKLPATTLANSCYYSMFNGCSSLYVSDTSGSSYSQEWTIPTSGTFTNTYSQTYMFTYCKGSRSSNNMAGSAGSSYTYYTQNAPV